MEKFVCPMSSVAIAHIEALTKSYKMAVDAASEYNHIAVADQKQMENALSLADHLGQAIESYLCGWEAGSPCLNYSCGWEYCKRNLEILDALPNLPDLPFQDFNSNTNININKNINNNTNYNSQND